MQKRYDYKIYDPNNNFLGLLSNVESDFAYNQTINSAGTQIQITVRQSVDVASLPVEAITDEAGNPITDESGSPILIERQPDVVGDGTMMANNNRVKIYEYSDYYPNGILVFTGYISAFEFMMGGSDNVVLTCLNDGQDLSNYLVMGAAAVDQSQLIQNSRVLIYEPGVLVGTAHRRVGQTFTVASGVTNLFGIILKLALPDITRPQTVTVSIFPNPASFYGTVALAKATQLVTSTLPFDFTFSFPEIGVVGGQQYFLAVTTSDDSGCYIYYQNTDVYVGGDMWVDSYGGGGGVISFVETPIGAIPLSDLYFETLYIQGAIYNAYINKDPSAMLGDLMNNYAALGGLVTTPGGYVSTGLTMSYAFKVQTVLQAIDTILQLAPANWYWYVDLASNTLFFSPSGTTADFTFIKGKHYETLKLRATKENIKNDGYFTGGDDGSGNNVFTHLQIAAGNNRVGLAMLSDNRVSGALAVPTALQIIQSYLDQNSSEEYYTELVVLDSTMDTSQFRVGKMVSLAGNGNIWDTLLLQVVGINKTPDKVTLQIGTLPRRSSKTVAKILSDLSYLQTVQNPAVPS